MIAGTRWWLALACLLAADLAWPSSCTILSTPTLNFGLYTFASGDLDAEGTLLVSCVPDPLAGSAVSYTLELSPGHGGAFHPRRLAAGGHHLRYNLYRDVTRTQIWGDGTAATFVGTGSCVGTCAIPIYGRIFAGQQPPAAQYRDDVLLTLDF